MPLSEKSFALLNREVTNQVAEENKVSLSTLFSTSLFKKQLYENLMIFTTFFITAACFPSLICYKPLPGQKKDDLWIGLINVGTFLVA